MYANLVETVDHSKKQAGQGCILAHCMGLGKTIQTLSFVQAVLSSKELDWCKKILVSNKKNYKKTKWRFRKNNFHNSCDYRKLENL